MRPSSASRHTQPTGQADIAGSSRNEPTTAALRTIPNPNTDTGPDGKFLLSIKNRKAKPDHGRADDPPSADPHSGSADPQTKTTGQKNREQPPRRDHPKTGDAKSHRAGIEDHTRRKVRSASPCRRSRSSRTTSPKPVAHRRWFVARPAITRLCINRQRQQMNSCLDEFQQDRRHQPPPNASSTSRLCLLADECSPHFLPIATLPTILFPRIPLWDSMADKRPKSSPIVPLLSKKAATRPQTRKPHISHNLKLAKMHCKTTR